MDIESVESGDGRPRRRLLAEVSDDPRSWATASSLVCLGREAANGAGTSSRDAQGSVLFQLGRLNCFRFINARRAPEKGGNFIRGHGRAVQVSLHLVTSLFPQSPLLLRRLDALGHHL